jgi:hypothetical protein
MVVVVVVVEADRVVIAGGKAEAEAEAEVGVDGGSRSGSHQQSCARVICHVSFSSLKRKVRTKVVSF